MAINLKTTLRAYPKMSPSILKDYVTRDELLQKDYVTHPELENILKDFVKEVVDGDPSTIYGRQNGEWVPIIEVPEKLSDVLCYGMLETDTINSQQLMSLNRRGLFEGIEEYLVECTPVKNGYFWFCCTKEIDGVAANNGLEYCQCIDNQPGVVKLTIDNKAVDFICYRTNKLAAIAGVTYKFRIRIR